MRTRRIAALLALASTVAGSATACGDDTASAAPTSDGGAEAAPDAPADPPSETEATQTGTIIRAQTEDEVVAGATVTVAGATATTNDLGQYTIVVPRDAPYQMRVAAEGFYTLVEQEWIVKKPAFDRGVTNLLLTATANLLAGLLPGRKADKGLLLVKVNPQSPCASEEGSTLAIDPPGEAKVAYFSGSLPDSQQATVVGGTTFSALFYNVEVGVPLTVTVTSPLCEQVPFPVELGDMTFTGVQRAEPGEALSYMRVYIKDPVARDAGAD